MRDRDLDPIALGDDEQTREDWEFDNADDLRDRQRDFEEMEDEE